MRSGEHRNNQMINYNQYWKIIINYSFTKGLWNAAPLCFLVYSSLLAFNHQKFHESGGFNLFFWYHCLSKSLLFDLLKPFSYISEDSALGHYHQSLPTGNDIPIYDSAHELSPSEIKIYHHHKTVAMVSQLTRCSLCHPDTSCLKHHHFQKIMCFCLVELPVWRQNKSTQCGLIRFIPVVVFFCAISWQAA